MLKRKKNTIWGRYPCCDMVNNAIRDILHGDNDSAIEDLENDVQKIHERIWKKRTAF